MKYTFNNDHKEGLMHVHVEIRKRTQYDQDLETVKWHDIQEIVSKEYSPPKGYVLGRCINELQNLHSDYRCSTTWTFELKEGQVLKFISAADDLPLKETNQFVSATETVKKPIPKRRKPKSPTSKKKVVKI